MLKVPAELAKDPRFAPALELCDDIWLSTADVARHFKCSQSWARTLRAKGEGPPCVKFGGVARYKLSAVLAWQYELERLARE